MSTTPDPVNIERCFRKSVLGQFAGCLGAIFSLAFLTGFGIIASLFFFSYKIFK